MPLSDSMVEISIGFEIIVWKSNRNALDGLMECLFDVAEEDLSFKDIFPNRISFVCVESEIITHGLGYQLLALLG